MVWCPAVSYAAQNCTEAVIFDWSGSKWDTPTYTPLCDCCTVDALRQISEPNSMSGKPYRNFLLFWILYELSNIHPFTLFQFFRRYNLVSLLRGIPIPLNSHFEHWLYIHKYIRTYLHTHMHAYIHTPTIHSYMQTHCIHIHTDI
jgi:hypothetical protein